MKTVKLDASTRIPDLARELAAVLDRGGIVCLPCAGRYRVVADLGSTDAVLSLMQTKRRVRPAPALVFIDGEGMLGSVAARVEPEALDLARRLWPLPLTIRVEPSEDLPSKVRKQLGGSKSRVGVRVPGERLARAVVGALGRPLLVSSANLERGSGAGSPAQVRKNLLRGVDVFVDRGDLAAEPPSTVIDVVDGRLVVERPGAVTEAMLAEVARPNAAESA